MVPYKYSTQYIPNWYHPGCFQKAARELDASDVAVKLIPGFKQLKALDQKLLIKMFGESGMTTVAG